MNEAINQVITNYKCRECMIGEFLTGKQLTNHISKVHKMDSKAYTKKHFCAGGIRPGCLKCGKETRYVAFQFKPYCKEHSLLAMSQGGTKGGRAPSWSKGKTKFDDSRLMKLSLDFSGDKNHFFGKSHTSDTIEKLKTQSVLTEQVFIERTQQRKKDFDILTEYKDYVSRQHFYLACKCVKCGLEQKKTLQALERGSLCRRCFPFTVSKEELEVGDFVESCGFTITRGDRSTIGPLELDIVVPLANLAIEYNGLYWHGENKKSTKQYHRQKTLKAKERDIQVIHIFSDEWLNKKDLVKSMLENRLGVCKNKLSARECDLVEVPREDSKRFFEENHIDGYARSFVTYGLKHPQHEDFVCCLSLRHPLLKRFHENKLELARFATKRGLVVRGGFGKLFEKAKLLARSKSHSSIISYCDLRFGTGQVYVKNGFLLKKDFTGLNYWYTDGKVRFDRFRFRAKEGVSEKEIAKKNNMFKIYGCGNALYEYVL